MAIRSPHFFRDRRFLAAPCFPFLLLALLALPLLLVSCAATTPSPTVSPVDWQSVPTGSTLQVVDGSPAAVVWDAKTTDAESVRAQVAAWLSLARPYRGVVPNSDLGGLVFHANVRPAALQVERPGGGVVAYLPAYSLRVDARNQLVTTYVTDVVRVEVDGEVVYLTCAPLYAWLKDEAWTSEFTQSGSSGT